MSVALLAGWQEQLPAETAPLPGGFSLLSLTAPTALLGAGLEEVRAAIVAVSDQAFGKPTRRSWDEKFTVGFLGGLRRFYLVTDRDGSLVGWSGYRVRTIAGERVVYFTSSGLLPRCQGSGVIPSVQRLALDLEDRRHPGCRLTLAIRTRNPRAYRLATQTFPNGVVVPGLDGRVPPGRRALVAAVASWLELSDVDPCTAIARGAYPVEGPLYGYEPRSRDPAVNDLFARLGPHDAILVLAASVTASR